MSPLDPLRNWLRRHHGWIEFREMNREGWSHAWRRKRIQPRILDTPPIRTAASGPVEVRVLTWWRDWLNLTWALKSFYHFAGVDYPLYIHDGGLRPGLVERLKEHFPDAHFVGLAEADRRVIATLQDRGLERCRTYRQLNPSTRKLFDFYVFSEAESVLTIDSDIVFFRRPDLLIVPPGGWPKNLYNEDQEYWYSMELDEMRESFGVEPPPRVNSGLAVVQRESIDFDLVEKWLGHPKMFENRWVTEQTLHALCSTVHGIELLPPTYRVGSRPGLSPDLVCKHYPGYFRPLLYEEGMTHLVATGFLDALRKGTSTPRVRPVEDAMVGNA